MRFNLTPLAVLALSTLLSACASASANYPSLAIRDEERVTGTLAPVEMPAPAPPALPAAEIGRLDQLSAEATSAHKTFAAQVADTRRLVSAAQGDAVGSEDWARAEVAVAGLDAQRSRAMIALADIDRLYVDAAVQGTALDQIGEVRDQVSAQVAEQNSTLDGMLASLR